MELIAKTKFSRDLGYAGGGVMEPELGAFDTPALEIVQRGHAEMAAE